jgi:hypothetical protein
MINVYATAADSYERIGLLTYRVSCIWRVLRRAQQTVNECLISRHSWTLYAVFLTDLSDGLDWANSMPNSKV